MHLRDSFHPSKLEASIMGVFNVFVSKDDKRSKFDPLIYDKKLVESIEDRSMARIKQLRNTYLGQRCFIIGSGPSLRDVDFSLLKGETLFGVNKSYKLYDMFGSKCKYVGVSDSRLFEEEDHRKLFDLSEDTTIFLSLSARKWYMERAPLFVSKNEPILIKRSPKLEVITDLAKGGGLGYTVLLDIALPAIYYMGFRAVYLLGVDYRYDGDAHYFDGSCNRYPKDGRNNQKISSRGWSEIKKTFDNDGRTIINCTPNSSLTNFNFIPLDRVLSDEKKKPLNLSAPYDVAAFSEWYHVVRTNLLNRKRWYISLPDSWWHGMTIEQFFEELPNHLDEPKWGRETLI